MKHEKNLCVMCALAVAATSTLFGQMRRPGQLELPSNAANITGIPVEGPRGDPGDLGVPTEMSGSMEPFGTDPFGSSLPNFNTPASTITVHELSHEIPSKARKEFETASKDRRKGDHESAVEHLKKAVSIDPQYWAAMNDLGVNYMDLRQPGLAIEPLQRAIGIDPHAPTAYGNLAAAYLIQGKNVEAERAARAEIDLDRIGNKGHFLLGAALVFQGKFAPEAEENLVRSAAAYPQARLLLAIVRTAEGEMNAARHELNEYVEAAPPEGVQLAYQWLDAIDRASQSGVPLKVRVTP